MTTILQLSDISKNFANRTVLKNVNLAIEKGTSVSLEGSSGSGKSTLLNIMGLLENPSSGSIIFQGKPYPKINSAVATKLRRSYISYLFQSLALINFQSAIDNVLIGMHYIKGTKATKKKQAKDMLARLGLEKVMSDKISTLSGGEQQRVAIARCLLKPSEIILADEPTGSLDHELALQTFSQLINLQQEYHKTLIVVTHDSDIAHQCQRSLMLYPMESGGYSVRDNSGISSSSDVSLDSVSNK